MIRCDLIVACLDDLSEFSRCVLGWTPPTPFCNMSVPRTRKRQLFHNTCNLAEAWCLNGFTVCYWKQAVPLRLSSSCPAVDKQAWALIVTMSDIAASYITLQHLICEFYQVVCFLRCSGVGVWLSFSFLFLTDVRKVLRVSVPCLVNIMAGALHAGIEPCLSPWACFRVYQDDYVRLCSLIDPCLLHATLPHVFVVYEHFWLRPMSSSLFTKMRVILLITATCSDEPSVASPFKKPHCMIEMQMCEIRSLVFCNTNEPLPQNHASCAWRSFWRCVMFELNQKKSLTFWADVNTDHRALAPSYRPVGNLGLLGAVRLACERHVPWFEPVLK